jgi:hypothetical protein
LTLAWSRCQIRLVWTTQTPAWNGLVMVSAPRMWRSCTPLAVSPAQCARSSSRYVPQPCTLNAQPLVLGWRERAVCLSHCPLQLRCTCAEEQALSHQHHFGHTDGRRACFISNCMPTMRVPVAVITGAHITFFRRWRPTSPPCQTRSDSRSALRRAEHTFSPKTLLATLTLGVSSGVLQTGWMLLTVSHVPFPD